MSEDKNLKKAKAVFQTICEMLDERNWSYEKHEDDLIITTAAKGEDLPIGVIIKVDDKYEVVTLFSPLPFQVPNDRVVATAIAVNQANVNIVDGSFDFDCNKGNITFRLSSSYRESLIGKGLFDYMLICSCVTVDLYNDRLLYVTENEMSANEIIDYINKGESR